MTHLRRCVGIPPDYPACPAAKWWPKRSARGRAGPSGGKVWGGPETEPNRVRTGCKVPGSPGEAEPDWFRASPGPWGVEGVQPGQNRVRGGKGAQPGRHRTWLRAPGSQLGQSRSGIGPSLARSELRQRQERPIRVRSEPGPARKGGVRLCPQLVALGLKGRETGRTRCKVTLVLGELGPTQSEQNWET